MLSFVTTLPETGTAALGFINIGTSEMIFIVFVALLLFGGKKLPELARGLGRGIREFKDASESIKRDITEQINNFEKDLDVKNIIEDEPKKLSDSRPQREPDYYGSQGPYYHDSYHQTDEQQPAAEEKGDQGEASSSQPA